MAATAREPVEVKAVDLSTTCFGYFLRMFCDACCLAISTTAGGCPAIIQLITTNSAPGRYFHNGSFIARSTTGNVNYNQLFARAPTQKTDGVFRLITRAFCTRDLRCRSSTSAVVTAMLFSDTRKYFLKLLASATLMYRVDSISPSLRS